MSPPSDFNRSQHSLAALFPGHLAFRRGWRVCPNHPLPLRYFDPARAPFDHVEIASSAAAEVDTIDRDLAWPDGVVEDPAKSSHHHCRLVRFRRELALDEVILSRSRYFTGSSSRRVRPQIASGEILGSLNQPAANPRLSSPRAAARCRLGTAPRSALPSARLAAPPLTSPAWLWQSGSGIGADRPPV